jgi:hypothetical protein
MIKGFKMEKRIIYKTDDGVAVNDLEAIQVT